MCILLGSSSLCPRGELHHRAKGACLGNWFGLEYVLGHSRNHSELQTTPDLLPLWAPLIATLAHLEAMSDPVQFCPPQPCTLLGYGTLHPSFAGVRPQGGGTQHVVWNTPQGRFLSLYNPSPSSSAGPNLIPSLPSLPDSLWIILIVLVVGESFGQSPVCFQWELIHM